MSTLRIGHQLNRQSSKVAGGKHERCPDMHAHDAGRRCRYSAHLLLHANRICSIAATTDHHRSRLISQCCFSLVANTAFRSRAMVARLLDSIDLDAIGHMRMTGVECTRRAMLLLLKGPTAGQHLSSLLSMLAFRVAQ